MARCWVIDGRGLARKVVNAGVPAAHQIKDCGANTQCPNCHFIIDNSNSREWPGLPAGVKFDPSDVELLGHLAAKRGVGKSDPHFFIQDFIPTLDGEGGICCTHPENLPGARKDGSSVYFFHRISNAYASGTRKRRRVEDHEGTRWHKTGRTKPVMENGIHKGFKKIMVLHEKPKSDKCNWVMHQYHLGSNVDEDGGEYVVSKIFLQPQKETDKTETSTMVREESDTKTAGPIFPMTPQTTTPDPPRQDTTPPSDCFSVDYYTKLHQLENPKKPYHVSYGSLLEDDEYATTHLDISTDAVVLSREDSLLCNEIFGDLRPNNHSSTQVYGDINAVHERDTFASCGFSELDNLELDTPPDFNDLQFPSQDSVFDSQDSVFDLLERM